jgi:hypothetical protein
MSRTSRVFFPDQQALGGCPQELISTELLEVKAEIVGQYDPSRVQPLVLGCGIPARGQIDVSRRYDSRTLVYDPVVPCPVDNRECFIERKIYSRPIRGVIYHGIGQTVGGYAQQVGATFEMTDSSPIQVHQEFLGECCCSSSITECPLGFSLGTYGSVFGKVGLCEIDPSTAQAQIDLCLGNVEQITFSDFSMQFLGADGYLYIINQTGGVEWDMNG